MLLVNNDLYLNLPQWIRANIVKCPPVQKFNAFGPFVLYRFFIYYFRTGIPVVLWANRRRYWPLAQYTSLDKFEYWVILIGAFREILVTSCHKCLNNNGFRLLIDMSVTQLAKLKAEPLGECHLKLVARTTDSFCTRLLYFNKKRRSPWFSVGKWWQVPATVTQMAPRHTSIEKKFTKYYKFISGYSWEKALASMANLFA